MEQREIKFRAYLHHAEEMVENFWVNGETIVYDDGKSFNTKEIDNEISIMQYTGLKDKNGKEIYEGDIIQTNHVSKGFVEFSPMASQWWIRFTDDVSYRRTYKELVPGAGGEDNYVTWGEIIGNIYENSELLNHSIKQEGI